MKVKPEILLTQDKRVLYKKILITGLDSLLIKYVADLFVSDFKRNNYFIDNSGTINNNIVGGLFTDKKTLFLINNPTKDIKEIEEDVFEDRSVLISGVNGKITNKIKKTFQNEQDSLVVECYPFNRSAKEVVIKHFINTNDFELSNNAYWYLVDNFENEYVFLVKQLETLFLYNKKIIEVSDIDKAVFVERKIDISKIFFQIYKGNNKIIEVYNTNICSLADFYMLLGYLKFYLEIISGSSNKEEALAKFPRYLFNEKDVFIKIYNQMNQLKTNEVYKNILKVEKTIRKQSGLFLNVGLRFLLNTKKIIIS